MADAPTLIFLHIQKAAGTTLHRIIERQYPARRIYSIDPNPGPQRGSIEAFMALPAAQRLHLQVLKGHFWYGLHDYVRQPAEYITLLREPVGRVVSFYHFVRRKPAHYLYDYLQVGNVPLGDAIAARATIAFDNLQTRLISGVWTDVPFGGCDDALLALAKQRLHDHFPVVGVSELFDETLLLLQRRYGWRHISYMRHNVSGDRPNAPLDAQTRALIEQHNRYDRALYEYARELCQAAIAAQGPAFAADLAAFRRHNARVQPLHRWYWRLREFSLRAAVRNWRGDGEAS